MNLIYGPNFVSKKKKINMQITLHLKAKRPKICNLRKPTQNTAYNKFKSNP